MTTAILEQPTVIPPLPPIPPTAPPPFVAKEPPFHLGRFLLGLIVVVAAFDICFWCAGAMGFSVGVFVPILAVAILANRENPWRRSTLMIGVLLAGACFAAMIETGVTNTLSLLILTLALAGDSFYDVADPAWARWFSQVLAMICAPGRPFWLAARLVEGTLGQNTGTMARAAAAVLLAIPAVILALVFGGLLASGNAVFGTWTHDAIDWLWNGLLDIFNFSRFGMWAAVVFVALPLLRPGWFASYWWNWIPKLPRWPELLPAQGATYSSALVLIVLNVIFGVANVADALFLWSGAPLPSGVTYSGYVHSGVNSLTFTVLLSAVVLTGIFQQHLGVAGRRGLKALGLLWSAQNLFLLVSVVLRLKLYTEAYDMTVARLSVIIFLLLVAAGYGLLAIKIVREKSLPWLAGGCAVAIFATFYITQFLNLAGWSVDYNVARWEQDRTRKLDLEYIYSLGAPGWPALQRAGNDGKWPWNSETNTQSSPRSQEDSLPRTRLDAQHWREFSLRAWWNRGAVEAK